ncbi:MAG TPA: CHAT domain-containing protein, partial [Thermoanaerobaculia bacterium]|nr:CHAT domain-containing protein [Thermoanaerobaculia bacterium]
PGQARERYEQALRLSPGDERAFFGLARVARAEGELDEAERWMEQTLDAIEAARDQVWRLDLRSSYLASRQEQYAFYIDLLAERHRREPDRGHDARAFAISERARARSLLDLLSVASQKPDPEEVRRVGELSRQVNTQHLDVLASSQGIEDGAPGSDLSDLLERLRQAEAEAQGPLTLERATPTLSLTQVQAELIDGETLLLEYFLGEERSFLWAVTSEETRFSILPGREEIEQAARQAYRRMLESHHQTGEIAARQAASRLSRMLLGPVADLLDRRRLVLVAPGSLQSVPFAALYHPQSGGRVAAQPLIAEHEIVSLPSASVLATLRTRTANRRPPPGLLAVVADPVFGPDDERLQGLRRGGEAGRARPSSLVTPWQRLRYTGREAEAILALAGSRSVLAASGFAANRDLVRNGRLGSYRVLHFATHGILNDLYPELSALALSAFDASGRPIDGHLRAYEISDLDLRADLVVLSACRTGLGKEVGGEGLVGLTQGFLHAGAPRLLVSLWDVDDRATGELMKRFYTGLFLQNLPPAQALRQAQLSLSREKRWRAPYYWAGFTLQGEWR